ncbi:hypothetical protein DEJ30_08110 [Curtobacterium sp. MCPF17_003]|uniref:hypothetical protein n=1 Tax=Curtobacterium sp. MCPF17_003 TaxID=2175637 RepID=UPI000D9A4C31|nr:hypothetical protein [Curtobacterium sp. MCPF17_003]PYY64419.1 hypothetical protein DEJ30_08110 [Curtobacterium sp. MCPF17_003]
MNLPPVYGQPPSTSRLRFDNDHTARLRLAGSARCRALIIAAVAAYVDVPLAPARITFESGVRVEIDGASKDRTVLVEAYAHTGVLRGGQPKKLATDAFKLAWAGQKLGSARLVIAVIDEDVEQYLLQPKAWLTEALRDSAVEVVRVSIDEDARTRVVDAQRLQTMSPSK